MLNNPLSFTDPSGFSFWTKWRRPIIGIVAGLITGGLAAGWMSAYALANGATMFATAAGGLTNIGVAAAAAAGGFASGGINGGNIQSALRGAFMAAITAGVVQGITDAIGGAVSGADVAGSGAMQHVVADGGGGYVQSPVPGQPVGVGPSDANLPDPNLAPHRLEQIEINGQRGPVLRLGDYSQSTGFGGFAARNLLNPAMGIPMGAIAGTLATMGGRAIASTGASMAARGAFSKHGGFFSSTTKSSGGKIYTSSGNIAQSDFAGYVDSSVMQGRQVNILSGVHGEISGAVRADVSMLQADIQQFGSLPGVRVFDMVELLSNPMQLRTILSSPGTTIGGFCNSGVCLKPYLP